MSRRKIVKRIVLAVFLALPVVWVASTKGPSYRDLQRSLGTTEEPLQFMARSIQEGMTRADVAKIVRLYQWFETGAADHFCPGGKEFYVYHLSMGPNWRWLPHDGYIGVCYDAQGQAISAYAESAD